MDEPSFSLDQVEADIRFCEELLAKDLQKFSSRAAPTRGAASSSSSAASAPSASRSAYAFPGASSSASNRPNAPAAAWEAQSAPTPSSSLLPPKDVPHSIRTSLSAHLSAVLDGRPASAPSQSALQSQPQPQQSMSSQEVFLQRRMQMQQQQEQPSQDNSSFLQTSRSAPPSQFQQDRQQYQPQQSSSQPQSSASSSSHRTFVRPSSAGPQRRAEDEPSAYSYSQQKELAKPQYYEQQQTPELQHDISSPVPSSRFNASSSSSLRSAAPPAAAAQAAQPAQAAPSSSRSRPQSAPRERPASAAGDNSSASVSSSARGLTPGRTRVTIPQEFSLSRSNSDRLKKDKIAAEMDAELAKQCTFKPELKASYASSKISIPHEERLAQLARTKEAERQKREKQKAEEEEKRLQEECTFKPKINPRPISPSRKAIPVSERLHHEADHRISARERARREALDAEMVAHPFTPRINHSPPLTPHNNAVPLQSSASAHSFFPHSSYQQQQSQSQSQQQQQYDMASYRPLHERVGDIQRKHNERIQQLRMEQETKNPDLTFRPQISENSDKMARRKSMSQSMDISSGYPQDMSYNQESHIVDRLTSDVNSAVDRKARKLQEDWVKKAEEECTFTPKLNPISEKLLSANQIYNSERDFVERQKKLEELARKKAEDEQRFFHKVEASEHTFQPQVSETSKLLAQAKQSRVGESFTDKVDRLVTKDSSKDHIAEHYYKQFTFKPKINKISRSIGQATPLDELVHNERNRRVKEDVAKKLEKETEEKCPFRPQSVGRSRTPGRAARGDDESSVSPPQRSPSRYSSSAAVNSSYNSSVLNSSEFQQQSKFADPSHISKMIAEYREQKEKKLEEARQQVQSETLKDCTFEPKINRQPPPTATQTGPIVVRGLGRFLERKELAKRLDEEKKDREDKAFKINGGSRPEGGITVPQPFNLHHDYHAEHRRNRVEEQIKQERQKECTFTPRTNEQVHRAILSRIMQSESASNISGSDMSSSFSHRHQHDAYDAQDDDDYNDGDEVQYSQYSAASTKRAVEAYLD